LRMLLRSVTYCSCILPALRRRSSSCPPPLLLLLPPPAPLLPRQPRRLPDPLSSALRSIIVENDSHSIAASQARTPSSKTQAHPPATASLQPPPARHLLTAPALIQLYSQHSGRSPIYHCATSSRPPFSTALCTQLSSSWNASTSLAETPQKLAAEKSYIRSASTPAAALAAAALVSRQVICHSPLQERSGVAVQVRSSVTCGV